MGVWDSLAGLADSGVVLGGSMASAIAIIVVAFRKRRDVDIVEMAKRINDLETRVGGLEKELHTTRETLVDRDRKLFLIRRTLAQNGIADPTLEAS